MKVRERRARQQPLVRRIVDAGRVHHLPADRVREVAQPPRRREDELRSGVVPTETTKRRYDRQEITQPEGAQSYDLHGHDVSAPVETIISRTSTPRGRVSANSTVCATSCGAASDASGAGLYFSSRPSK